MNMSVDRSTLSTIHSTQTAVQPATEHKPRALVTGTVAQPRLTQLAENMNSAFKTYTTSATAPTPNPKQSSDISHANFVSFIRNLQNDLDQLQKQGCEKVDLVALVMGRTEASLIKESLTKEISPQKWNAALQEAYQFVTVLQALLQKEGLLKEGGNVVVVNEQTGEGIDFTRQAFESLLRYSAQGVGQKGVSLNAISTHKIDESAMAAINNLARASQSGQTADHLDLRTGQEISKVSLSKVKPLPAPTGRLLVVIPGIRDEDSIAYHVADQLSKVYGDKIDFVFTYRGKDELPGNQRAAEKFGNATIMQCDVSNIKNIQGTMQKIAEKFNNRAIDVFVHSVAFTHRDTLTGNLLDTMRTPYFSLASQISAASFLQFVQAAQKQGIWNENSVAATMSYVGGPKIAQNYDGMGAHKASLEQLTTLLAADPEIKGHFITLSPGPLPTKAAQAISGFENLMNFEEARLLSQTGLLTQDDVGRVLANMIATRSAPFYNGETVKIDKGTSKVEVPPLERLKTESVKNGYHATLMEGRHFKAEAKGDHLEIQFNSTGKSANVLSSEGINELEKAVDRIIEGTKSGELSGMKGIILSSGKNNFCLGADIDEFRMMFAKPTAELEGEMNRVHNVFRKLETQPLPVVSELRGMAIGGGHELALASDLIVSTPTSQFMLPECKNVQVMPGYGGITRQLSKVNSDTAKFSTMQTILSGEPITAARGQRLGIIDAVVQDPRDLRAKTLELLKEMTPEKLAAIRARKEAPLFKAEDLEKHNDQFAILKSQAKVIPKMLRQPGNQGTKAAVNALIESVGKPIDDALRIEAKHFAKCAQTLGAASAVGNFAKRNDLGKTKLDMTSVRDHYAAQGVPTKEIAIIGVGGTMGSGIALDSAAHGVKVTGLTRPGEQDNAQARLNNSIDQATRRQPQAAPKIKDAIRLATKTDDTSELKGKQIIIEAGPENMKFKKEIMNFIAKHSDPDAVIATNTSTLSVTEMAKALPEGARERVIGIHFFNPAPKMPLVEVVVSDFTSQKTIANTMAYLKKMGKTGVIVKDRPGFAVNATLTPVLDQGRRMIEEGIDIHRIDTWLQRNGWPMGIGVLSDLIGIDVCKAVMNTMSNAHPEKYGSHQNSLYEQLSTSGKKGKVNGEGFYQYEKGQLKTGKDGKPVKSEQIAALYNPEKDKATSDEEIRLRLGVSAGLEAVRNLSTLSDDYNYNSDGVRIPDATKTRARVLDATLTLGLGAPAAIGFLDELANALEKEHGGNGMQHVLDLCNELQARYGDAFKAPQLLVDLAQNNGRFK